MTNNEYEKLSVESATGESEIAWIDAHIEHHLRQVDNLTEKQARHEIEKLAETVVRANGQAMQNQYDAETYRDRVKMVTESLFNAIYDTDRVGIFKTMSRAFSSFGVPDGVHK